MIQQETFLQIIDNSGIKTVKCIGVLGGANVASQGKVIKASVQELRHNKSKKVPFKKGDIVYCLIVHTRFLLKRKNGQHLKFFKNCAILIDKNKKPLGTRISSPLLKELRNKKYLKLLSLSSAVI